MQIREKGSIDWFFNLVMSQPLLSMGEWTKCIHVVSCFILGSKNKQHSPSVVAVYIKHVFVFVFPIHFDHDITGMTRLLILCHKCGKTCGEAF